VLGLACLPLAVLAYEGRGYANGTLTTGAGAPLVTSFVGEFFTLLIVLAAFGFLLRHGTLWGRGERWLLRRHSAAPAGPAGGRAERCAAVRGRAAGHAGGPARRSRGRGAGVAGEPLGRFTRIR
jgi:hypothetical protein